MTGIPRIGKSPNPNGQGRRPLVLWQSGFRPFYLLASAFASLSVALWTAQYAGWLPRPYLAGPVLHAHEMIFGFVLAVVTGFLFTAVRNWTGFPTPTGKTLAALAVLWIAGRILVLTPWPWASAAANTAFPVAVAWGIGVPLFRSGNRRNFFFVGALLLISAAILVLYLVEAGVLALGPWFGIQVALDTVLFVMIVMAGRVVPMFTNNAIRGANAKRFLSLERLALGSILVLLVTDAAQVHGLLLIAVLGLGAAFHVVRLWLWEPRKTLSAPLVWILHAAYAWIPAYLVLRCLSELGYVAPALCVHALTIGAIGGLTIGMMTRTALGHTGRPLKAGRAEIACYALILAAAMVRVFGPMLMPAAYSVTVIASGCLWSAGYGLYAVRYWPILTGPRLDGKPG